MKKFYISLAVLTLASAWFLLGRGTSAQVEVQGTAEVAVSPNLVISQFQTGRASPNFEDEFVEIHNTSSSPLDLNGYRLVYRSATGQTDVANPFAVWTTSTIIPAGGFYLVAASGYNGSVAPNLTYVPATCQCSMGGTAGGLAIRNGPSNTGAIIDSVAWGTVSNGFAEGTSTTAHPIDANDNSKVRQQNGCQDSDNNANDFSTLTPAAPRNAASSPVTCAGAGTQLFAAINANPVTVTPPGSTRLTVTVVPATTPPSTGITVIGNLSSVGGSASQPFFDNGTNGDVTAGDNVFSYLVSFPAGTSGGSRTVTAVASDAQGRTVNNLTQVININAQLPNENPLLFGNPSNATRDVANEENYLMQKPQYTLSYKRSYATANWVAWRLDTSWMGDVNRQDDFRPDPTLPAGWYQVQDNDYSNSGQTRGHMVSSEERTNTVENNSATFLMTNIIPQIANLNSGPWNNLEQYLINLAQQGNEIYTISGPSGNIGTIGATQQNRIVVPRVSWKVVIVMPNNSDDLRRATRLTRAFGVIMSNEMINSSSPWRNFRVTVDEVEALTGFNFFSEIPEHIQELIERRRDTQ